MKNKQLYIYLFTTITLIGCEPKEQINTADSSVEYAYMQHRSEKRGVSYNFQIIEDAPLLGGGVSWFYNWDSNVPDMVDNATSTQKMDFFPMAWNGSFDANRIRTYKGKHPQCTYILGFNEPNLIDQANMTPTAAAKLWKPLQALAKELGMKIISPAMNYGTLSGYSDPIKWLDEFFTMVPLSEIDGIAIHCYMGNPASMKQYVRMFLKYGKPIWMTEFCAWENLHSVIGQMQYMSNAVNYLESDPAVFRYAWFIPRSNVPINAMPYNQLLAKKRPYELSDLGKIYVHMSTFDKSIYYPIDKAIPAEQYSNMNLAEKSTEAAWIDGVQLRPTTDKTGLLELSDFRSPQWVEYQVEIPSDGKYNFEIRYASDVVENECEIKSNNKLLSTIPLPGTGSINKWTTNSEEITLNGGKQTIRFYMTKGLSCVNWIRIKTKI